MVMDKIIVPHQQRYPRPIRFPHFRPLTNTHQTTRKGKPKSHQGHGATPRRRVSIPTLQRQQNARCTSRSVPKPPPTPPLRRFSKLLCLPQAQLCTLLLEFPFCSAWFLSLGILPTPSSSNLAGYWVMVLDWKQPAWGDKFRLS